MHVITLMRPYSDAYTANVVAVYRQSDMERALARAVPVHVNTLRYRLRRFEGLTGCSRTH